MISKNSLKGKYIDYLDRDQKFRSEKVVRITGNVLTVVNAVGRRARVKKDMVLGRRFRKKGLEEIEWVK